MIKAAVITLLCAMLYSPVIYAGGIVVEPDNLTGTINYCTIETSVWRELSDYGIIKNINNEEKNTYFLRVYLKKFLTKDEADISVDGKVFKAKKVINSWHPSYPPKTVYIVPSFFVIPQECISLIKKNSKISFTIYPYGDKPLSRTILSHMNAELMNIIDNGHFNNYLDDINENNVKYQVKK